MVHYTLVKNWSRDEQEMNYFSVPTYAQFIHFKTNKKLILKHLTFAPTCFGLS
jgi:hypothetical protein